MFWKFEFRVFKSEKTTWNESPGTLGYYILTSFLEHTDLNRIKLSTSIFSYSIVAFLDFRNHISRGNSWLRHLNKLQVTLFKENEPVLLGWDYSLWFWITIFYFSNFDCCNLVTYSQGLSAVSSIILSLRRKLTYPYS